MKKIEQLEVKDLKQAFKDYLEKDGPDVELDRHQMRREWEKFWGRLHNKCSVVETS